MKKKKNQTKPANRAELENMLLDQPLCCHQREIARWLLANGAKEECIPEGRLLIREGDKVNRDVFCVLAGTFRIEIGGHSVGERGKKHHIGEMAMIMREARTASAIAVLESKVLRIPENVMRKALKRYPCMWEPLAQTLCDRLHERRKFFRVKNKNPIVFVGSSGARSFVAEALKARLQPRIKGEVRVWSSKDIFEPSSNTLQRLIDHSKQCDFGIFIFGADDKVKSKGENFAAPRDNVVFEGGMFTSSCGICRTIFVCEKNAKLKVPSDLSGVTYLEFGVTQKQGVTFGNSISRIADLIKKLRAI